MSSRSERGCAYASGMPQSLRQPGCWCARSVARPFLKSHACSCSETIQSLMFLKASTSGRLITLRR